MEITEPHYSLEVRQTPFGITEPEKENTMNYRRMEIKDDGEAVVVKMGKKDFARLEKLFLRLDIAVKKASKKEATFIFSRSDYDKIVSWTENRSKGIKVVRKSPKFFYLEIEDTGRFVDIMSNIDSRPVIYVCSSCGFSTENISELHEKNAGGGASHSHRCERMTENEYVEWKEARDEYYKDLEKTFQIVSIDDCYGRHSDCSICREEA